MFFNVLVQKFENFYYDNVFGEMSPFCQILSSKGRVCGPDPTDMTKERAGHLCHTRTHFLSAHALFLGTYTKTILLAAGLKQPSDRYMESERSRRDNGLIKEISVTRKNAIVLRSSRTQSFEAPFLSIAYSWLIYTLTVY